MSVPAEATIQAAALGGSGWGVWIGAGVSLAVAVALGMAARWAVRRLGTRHDTVTSTVQIMARLVFFVIVAVGTYIALRTIGLDLGPVLAGATSPAS